MELPRLELTVVVIVVGRDLIGLQISATSCLTTQQVNKQS